MIKAITQIPHNEYKGALEIKHFEPEMIKYALKNAREAMTCKVFTDYYQIGSKRTRAKVYTALIYALRREYLCGYEDALTEDEQYFVNKYHSSDYTDKRKAHDSRLQACIEEALRDADHYGEAYCACNEDARHFPFVTLAQAYYNTFSTNA